MESERHLKLSFNGAVLMGEFVRKVPYRGTVQAAVFDWAGTGVDYGCQGPVSVFIDAFALRGVEASVAEARAPMGLMKRDHVRAMLAAPGIAGQWSEKFGHSPTESDVDAVYADTERLMIGSIRNNADPVPGAVQAIERLRAMGLKIGSCTGYTREMVDVVAAVAAGKGYVPDAVICSSDVPAGRPNPWMCYLNAIRLGVYPMEAMVKVGDTVADIEEGLNAGMWSVGLVMTGNDLGLTAKEAEALSDEELDTRMQPVREKFLAAGAHYVLDGIWDVPVVVEQINERLARGEHPLSGR